MVRYLLPRILLPLLLLAGLELAFRLGAWEPLAARDSHAGTSIRARQALEAHEGRIDYITLGSSRAEYGFDHALIHAHARSRGQVHLNLSQPGSHWLTITTISAWVKARHPELKGGVIGLSYLDFQYPYNGAYELAIVEPFRPMFARTPLLDLQFNRHNLNSYGAWSSLFSYRQDIRNLLANPGKRLHTNTWYAENKPWRFDENPETGRDVCGLPWQSIPECLAATPESDAARAMQAACRTFSPSGDRVDWSGLGTDLPSDRADTQRLIREAIRGLGWPQPPVIVLLPTTHHWRESLAPIGADAWALRLLQPLADAGEIVLIDRTRAFDVNDKTRCDVFIDLHHQNGVGAAELTSALLPEFDRHLYGESAPPKDP